MWKSLRHKLFPKEKLPKGPKQIVLFLVCLSMGFLVLIYVGRTVPKRIAFSRTNSLSHRFFYYKDRFTIEDLKSGRYVIFPIYTKIVDNCWPCKVVKKIGCDEGDRLLTTKEGYYYCGDTYLGHAKTHSKKGIPVENYKYDGIVPKGKFFAIGSCPDSFDSRYIGILDKKNVQAVAIPLF